jgi:hypothetical protein
MKKALLFAVSIVLVTLVFSGCKDDVTTVTGVRASQVAEVTVTATTDGKYAIISWDAVEGASDYNVYAKIKDGVSVVSIGSGQNTNVYLLANGNLDDNANFDKWSARVDIDTATTSLPGKVGTEFYFGVQTEGVITDNSDIK